MTLTASEVIVHRTVVSRSRLLGSFPWVVFTLTFGLLLSDYMSRQVLSAVFPFLKTEWALTDTQLGSLTSIVALTVGILAVPLSLLGDRWGRVRAVVAHGGRLEPRHRSARRSPPTTASCSSPGSSSGSARRPTAASASRSCSPSSPPTGVRR